MWQQQGQQTHRPSNNENKTAANNKELSFFPPSSQLFNMYYFKFLFIIQWLVLANNYLIWGYFPPQGSKRLILIKKRRGWVSLWDSELPQLLSLLCMYIPSCIAQLKTFRACLCSVETQKNLRKDLTLDDLLPNILRPLSLVYFRKEPTKQQRSWYVYIMEMKLGLRGTWWLSWPWRTAVSCLRILP